jgi:biotin operon repressor
MGRKATVEKLPDDQFDFVIAAILNGWTDREISSQFRQKFETELPKSSLNTWRNKAGNELAERYRMKRFQVRSVVEQLKSEGIDVTEDKYSHIIQSLEDHLLTDERNLLAQNPMKLLVARQEDERLKIQREKIELQREQLALERQKLLGQQMDPVKNGTEFMTELFDYLKDDSDGVLFVKKIARPFIEFLEKKYASAEA